MSHVDLEIIINENDYIKFNWIRVFFIVELINLKKLLLYINLI